VVRSFCFVFFYSFRSGSALIPRWPALSLTYLPTSHPSLFLCGSTRSKRDRGPSLVQMSMEWAPMSKPLYSFPLFFINVVEGSPFRGGRAARFFFLHPPNYDRVCSFPCHRRLCLFLTVLGGDVILFQPSFPLFSCRHGLRSGEPDRLQPRELDLPWPLPSLLG